MKARVTSLGVDTIEGINIGTSSNSSGILQFSFVDFGITPGSAVRGAAAAVAGGPAANTDGNFYGPTAVGAPSGDLNGSNTRNDGAIVFVPSTVCGGGKRLVRQQ